VKVIITGSRNHNLTFSEVDSAVRASGFPITEVVASSDDTAAQTWAREAEQEVHLTLFDTDWDKYGKDAGPKCNRQMVGYADALIVFWDGKSHRTKNMIQEAEKCRLKIHKIMVALQGQRKG
jgi:hypothetical protein